MAMTLIRLGEVEFDATRAKANNSRHAPRATKTLADKPPAPDELGQVAQRRQRVHEALPHAQADEARRRQRIDPLKNQTTLPLPT